MFFLKSKEQEKLKKLNSKKEGLTAQQEELDKNKSQIADVEQEQFNLIYGALDQNLQSSRVMEEKANLAKQKGGVIQMAFSVQGPDDEEAQIIQIDLSNTEVNQDPALNTYRERIINDGVSYLRQVLTLHMQKMRQAQPQQLAVYTEKKRKEQFVEVAAKKA